MFSKYDKILNSNFLNFFKFLSIIFISLSIVTNVKSNEMDDLKKIGFYKENVDIIYGQMLSVLDYTTLIEDIITELEEETKNKKTAMTEGMQILNEAKKTLTDSSNKLNNLEPLLVSSTELKEIANTYDEVKIFLKNKVLPLMKEELIESEKAFLKALKGDFGNFLERWSKSLNKAIILLDGENEFLKISISSIGKDHPNNGLYLAVIESNNFAKELLLGVQFLLKNLENDEKLKYYLSDLQLTLDKILKNTKSALNKSEIDQENLINVYAQTELTDQEKELLNKMFLAFNESRYVEMELYNTMKKLAKNFTYNNYVENENFLYDLMDGFNEISYYSTLREESQIKQARILQNIE